MAGLQAKSLRGVIAGGGTGGHLFPGIAVAQEITSRDPGAELLFVTGKRPMEAEVLGRHGFRSVGITVEGLKGRGVIKGLGTGLSLPRAMGESYRILKEFAPRFVLGMGGYSAGPVCLVSRWLGIPSAIHEQNACPGLTNRLLSRVVDRAFVSFEGTECALGKVRACVTGNPIRAAFFKTFPEPPPSPFTVLAAGGSQGARAINDAVVAASVLLKGQGEEVAILHQTGKADLPRVAALYRENGLSVDPVGFFEDMASVYARAHLVISRAGAGTVFELAAMGKPSLLVPYPHAANRHQEKNAGVLAAAGGAEILLQGNLSGEALAERICAFRKDPVRRRAMGSRAKAWARPDAARHIVDCLLSGGERGGKSSRGKRP